MAWTSKSRSITVGLLWSCAELGGTSPTLAREVWAVEDAVDELRTALHRGLLGPGHESLIPGDRLTSFMSEVLVKLAESPQLPDAAREPLTKVANRAMILHRDLDDALRASRGGGPARRAALPALDERWSALDETLRELVAALPADLFRPRPMTPSERHALQLERTTQARESARRLVLGVLELGYQCAWVRLLEPGFTGLVGSGRATIDGCLDTLGSGELVALLPAPEAMKLAACLERWETLGAALREDPAATPGARHDEAERFARELDLLLVESRALSAAWDALARANGAPVPDGFHAELEEVEEAFEELRSHVFGALFGLQSRAAPLAAARQRLARLVQGFVAAPSPSLRAGVRALEEARAALDAAIDPARGAKQDTISPAIDTLCDALARFSQTREELASALQER